MTDHRPPPDDLPARPPAPRPAGTVKVGTLAGADVLVSSSWFLIAMLIAVMISPRIEQVQPGLGIWKYVAGLAFAVVLYLSVLLHEASHAYMARHYGFSISSITLHFLGGMTAIDGESRNPKEEFMVAVVGPLSSILVGVVGVGLWFITPSGTLLQVAVEALAGANLLVGVLNLVPGLPLDGGRVLKSMIWGATGSPHQGTLVAGWVGRVLAVLVLAWPFAMQQIWGTTPQILDFVIMGVLAVFLWMGASAAMSGARLRQRLPQLRARPLARSALAVPVDLPLSEAVRRAAAAQAASLVTVGSDGRPTGIVSEQALHATPDDRRPWVPVSSVAHTLQEGLTLPADISGEELILAISRRPASEYLLVEPDGQVLGVLATADVDRAFREGNQ